MPMPPKRYRTCKNCVHYNAQVVAYPGQGVCTRKVKEYSTPEGDMVSMPWVTFKNRCVAWKWHNPKDKGGQYGWQATGLQSLLDISRRRNRLVGRQRSTVDHKDQKRKRNAERKPHPQNRWEGNKTQAARIPKQKQLAQHTISL